MLMLGLIARWREAWLRSLDKRELSDPPPAVVRSSLLFLAIVAGIELLAPGSMTGAHYSDLVEGRGGDVNCLHSITAPRDRESTPLPSDVDKPAVERAAPGKVFLRDVPANHPELAAPAGAVFRPGC